VPRESAGVTRRMAVPWNRSRRCRWALVHPPARPDGDEEERLPMGTAKTVPARPTLSGGPDGIAAGASMEIRSHLVFTNRPTASPAPLSTRTR
jgi:hypothetical protein